MTPHPASARPAGVCLLGTGMAVPPRVVINDELAQTVDTSDQWITQRTGIKQRRVIGPDTTERDLAREALAVAIQDAGIGPHELGMVICATMTAEMCCPSTAARLASEIGAAPAGAMDISVACSGFVYGMNLAASLIETGRCKTVAVVGAEALSRIVDWKDRRTCVLFGDGAGAAIFAACDAPQRGCLHQTMASNGEQWSQLYVPREPKHVPEACNTFNGTYNTLQMNGREVYKFAVTTLGQMIEQALSDCGLDASDLAMVIPHQSNQRILESVREKLGLPPEKLYINIDQYGNTSAASVPICLHELRVAGRVKPGDLVLFVALGGGCRGRRACGGCDGLRDKRQGLGFVRCLTHGPRRAQGCLILG